MSLYNCYAQVHLLRKLTPAFIGVYYGTKLIYWYQMIRLVPNYHNAINGYSICACNSPAAR